MKSFVFSHRLTLLILLLWGWGYASLFAQQKNNLSLTGTATASSFQPGFEPAKAIDGKISSGSSWKNVADGNPAWLMLKLPGATEILSITIQTPQEAPVISDFKIQTILNGSWRNAKEISGNTNHQVTISFDPPLLIDRLQLWTESAAQIEVSEFEVYGQQYVDSTATEVKKILVNQSGYNLGRPKRFSAPEMIEKTPFEVVRKSDREVVFSGIIENGKGDFSGFNPETQEEFIIAANGQESFPFRIGPNWLDRVTYRHMVDFMIGARHYVGNVSEIRPISFEWRDGDFFNWAMQSLVAMYLSNPEAYDRMKVTSSYVSNSTFPENYRGFWGKLEPFRPETPDIIQLIHWDADVKVSKGLDHEMQKAELAHFLYAWPYLQKWLPRQNFDAVYAYATSMWEKASVSKHSLSQYDLSPEHNLLALKTQLGTTKGEMPPGFSVIPNLMMYEVAKREGAKDAEKYFDAAYRQLDWMIKNLDWNDPMTTKGQRMSEHMTMRAFAFFQSNYPDRAPDRLKEKVQEWATIAIARSDNFWDFRKYDETEWTPPGWNETGNILGFPAAVFSAMTVLDDSDLKKSLEILAWSHFENSFGRNPTGRQFSYKGPEEVEGVDLGWYSRHKGGYGLLEDLPFVFDGSPKSFHYPNHPEAGNLGWTEGWVQFNTAFNTSMAYMANYYTKLEASLEGKDRLVIRLEAPLNFDSMVEEKVEVVIRNQQGEEIKATLAEEAPFSLGMKGEFELKNGKLLLGDQSFSWKKGESIEVSYGLGYFRKVTKVDLK